MKRTQTLGSCGKIIIAIIVIQLVALVALFYRSPAQEKIIIQRDGEEIHCPTCPSCPTCPNCPKCPTCPKCPVCSTVTSTQNQPSEQDQPVLPFDFSSPAQTSWPIHRVEKPTQFWMCLRPQEVLSEHVKSTTFYAPREAMIFKYILENPETGCKSVPGGKWVVDVGSQMGFFSMLSAAYGCNVISVDPQSHWYPNFLISRRINGFDKKITLYKGVVTANANSKANVGFDYFHGGVHGLGTAEAGKSLEVDSFRLDDILAKHNVHDILLLKIDVEGYEMEVLGGMTNYKGTIQNYVMEIKLGLNVGGGDAAKVEWLKAKIAEGFNAYQFVEEYGVAKEFDWNPLANHHFRYREDANDVSEDFWLTKDEAMNQQFP